MKKFKNLILMKDNIGGNMVFNRTLHRDMWLYVADGGTKYEWIRQAKLGCEDCKNPPCDLRDGMTACLEQNNDCFACVIDRIDGFNDCGHCPIFTAHEACAKPDSLFSAWLGTSDVIEKKLFAELIANREVRMGFTFI